MNVIYISADRPMSYQEWALRLTDEQLAEELAALPQLDMTNEWNSARCRALQHEAMYRAWLPGSYEAISITAGEECAAPHHFSMALNPNLVACDGASLGAQGVVSAIERQSDTLLPYLVSSLFRPMA